MKVVDLHPEDLLDKEARGELSEAERSRLDAHLARCAICRFELDARADFAEELEADSSDDSMPRLLALVEKTEEVDDAQVEVEDGDEHEDVSPKSRRRGRRKLGRVALLVAAALMVGSVATAKSESGAHVWARITSLFSDATVTETELRTPASSAAPVVVSSVGAVRTAQKPAEEVIEPSSPAPAPSASVIIAVASTLPTASPRVETAATLFEDVNAARRQGDYVRAIMLHRRLQEEHPSSREAHVSHATIGRLLLDRGDPASALASFDAYQMRGAGALDEAVMVGRATALDRLGRTEEARKAWTTLLAAFPETPYAEHARTRAGGASGP